MNPGAFTLGPNNYPPIAGGCSPATISIKAAGKVDKKESDGKNDARVTWKGRKAADIRISFTWKEDGDINGNPGPIETAVEAFLLEISPRGANGGKTWDFNALDAKKHKISSMMVEEIETKRTPGTGMATCDISGASWVKPKAVAGGKGTGKTPDAAAGWTMHGKSKAGAKGGGGSSDGSPPPKGFDGPNAPKAKP